MPYPNHLLLPNWLCSEEEWNCAVKIANSQFRYDILCNDIAHSKSVITLRQFWEIIDMISKDTQKKHNINISERRNALFSLIYDEEPMYNHIVRERKLKEIEAIKGFSIKKSGWLNRFGCVTGGSDDCEEKKYSIHKEYPIDENCEKNSQTCGIGCSNFRYKTDKEIVLANDIESTETKIEKKGVWETDGNTSSKSEDEVPQGFFINGFDELKATSTYEYASTDEDSNSSVDVIDIDSF